MKRIFIFCLLTVACLIAHAQVPYDATYDVNKDSKCDIADVTCVVRYILNKSTIDVESVTLPKAKMTLVVGGTTQLLPTVAPDDATDKTIVWTSGNTAVATVAEDGTITAVAAGSTLITAKAKAGNGKATCYVNVKASAEETDNNGHPYVDLGLTTEAGEVLFFATTNLGALRPEQFGDLFAWGDTIPQGTTQFSWSTYSLCGGAYNNLTKYCTSSVYGNVDNLATLQLANDPAHTNWGGKWRMPTSSELEQLITKCTWTWITRNGVEGYEVKATNGNLIFLPAAGYCDKGVFDENNCYGRYWTATRNETLDYRASSLNFSADKKGYADNANRYEGFSIRPVYEKNTLTGNYGISAGGNAGDSGSPEQDVKGESTLE